MCDNRSKKVNEILDDKPSGILKWGVPLIGVVLALSIIFVLNLSYPYGQGEKIIDHVLSKIF